jgi:hypothetical protein
MEHLADRALMRYADLSEQRYAAMPIPFQAHLQS